MTIGGDESTGEAPSGAGIRATDQLGPVVIKGSVLGTPESPYRIFGGGVTSGFSSLAVKSVKIGGDFEHGVIVGGFIVSGNPDAQIGPVSVGGDWIASSVTAGLLPGSGKFIFGNGDDVFINAGPAGVIASIASITIKGRTVGTLETGDRFGIVAAQIGAVTIGGVKLGLTPDAANDLAGFNIGPTPDFLIREVA